MKQLTLTPEQLEQRLVLVPAWMEEVLAEARKLGRLVEYTYRSTGFGTFPLALEVSSVEA